MKLTKKIKIKLIYTNLTGLYIGGNKEDVKIGGLDNPIIKIKDNNEEFIYIPGSSIKGKIRSLLEKSGYSSRDYSKEEGNPCECGGCDVCKLFGPHNSKNSKEPRRLIFRDSNYINYLDITEEKIENIINRITGTSNNIRKQERIIPGTVFEQEIIFDVYDKRDVELFETFIKGLELLENDYLGGSGSRGYGKIKFLDIEIDEKGLETNYKDFIKNEGIPRVPLEKINELSNKPSVIDKEKLKNRFKELISDNDGNSNV